jgi:hypothetical protein
MNVYLLPMISPSKYVVKLGWSSVRPTNYQLRTTVRLGLGQARTFDAQISAQEGVAHIDVFDLDLDLVLLTIGGLVSFEATAGAEQR